jgi:hypothetical protein
MKTLDEKIEEAAWELCEYDHDKDKKSFIAGANFVKAEMQREIDHHKALQRENSNLKSLLAKAVDTLELVAYWADREQDFEDYLRHAITEIKKEMEE